MFLAATTRNNRKLMFRVHCSLPVYSVKKRKIYGDDNAGQKSRREEAENTVALPPDARPRMGAHPLHLSVLQSNFQPENSNQNKVAFCHFGHGEKEETRRGQGRHFLSAPPASSHRTWRWMSGSRRSGKTTMMVLYTWNGILYAKVFMKYEKIQEKTNCYSDLTTTLDWLIVWTNWYVANQSINRMIVRIFG